MNSFYKGFFFAFLFLGFLGVLTAVGFHTADEILGGTFAGDYIFTGKVDFNSANIIGGGTQSLVVGWPDAIKCGSSIFFLHYADDTLA